MERDSDVAQPRATTATSFICFPAELHHYILCYADPEDIIALRKTCKYFLALTQVPRLWTTVYDRMRNTHPLSYSHSEFAALATWQSERLLVGASKTEKLFKTFRYGIQHRIIPDGKTHKPDPLAALSFLSERFILSADSTTVICVWDMWKFASSRAAGLPSPPCASLTLVDWYFDTYSMSINDSTLYVVVSNGGRARIFSLFLPLNASDTDESELSFRDVAYVDVRFRQVNSFDPDSCLVLLEHSVNMIEVVDWRTQSRSIVTLEGGAPENYVCALRICGPYILCFRRLSIEAHPIPLKFLKPELATEQPLPVLHHTLTNMGPVTRISLSHVRCSRSPLGNVYSIGALAKKAYQGMFHYLIHLEMTPEPSLSLRLLGANNGNTSRHIYTWDLGMTGLRGVWVREPKRNGQCRVVAFTTHPSRRPFDPSGGRKESSPRFDEKVLSVLTPQNRSDHVKICAVSEFTGQIALGSLTGVITLL